MASVPLPDMRFANEVAQISALFRTAPIFRSPRAGADPASMTAMRPRGVADLVREDEKTAIANEVAWFSGASRRGTSRPLRHGAALLAPAYSYVGCMVTPAPSLPKDFSQLSLAEAAELLAARKLPPVDQWHPERTGDSAMEIRADGSWYHEGGRINRPAMVKLFSTILRREADGSHVLVTPAEKLAIAVEDTPFRAVEMKSEGTGAARKLVFRLDTDDLVLAGADHPLSFGRDPDHPDPRLHVRGTLGNGLEARIDRALYYEIVDMALTEGDDPPAIWSNGARFPLVDR